MNHDAMIENIKSEIAKDTATIEELTEIRQTANDGIKAARESLATNERLLKALVPVPRTRKPKEEPKPVVPDATPPVAPAFTPTI